MNITYKINCLHTLLKLNSSLTLNINFQFILYISDLINILLNFYLKFLKIKSIFLYFYLFEQCLPMRIFHVYIFFLIGLIVYEIRQVATLHAWPPYPSFPYNQYL